MIRIALVDDHVVLRKSLAILVNMLPDFRVTIQAGNGEELIGQLVPGYLPDIVLLDIAMPVMDGLETARWLRQNHPKIKILVLSVLRNDLVIIRMLKNGARGFILKDCDPKELKHALLHVYKRGYYYNEYFTPKMRKRNAADGTLKAMINEKELNFLQLVCTEKSYKEIADAMKMSPRTVDGYRDSLFQKLNLKTRVGLAIYAIKNGIVVL